jgi:hypothetical protein
MNKRLVVISLLILLVPPLLNIVIFSLLNMVTPSIGGFDIFSLTKASGYIIVPIIYIITFALMILRYKVTYDSQTITAIVVAGLLLLPLVFIPLKRILAPNLALVPTTVGMPTDMGAEYSAFFRNQIIIGVYYLSFNLSLFLATYSENRTVKTLIFILGGIALAFVLSVAYTYIYTLLA